MTAPHNYGARWTPEDDRLLIESSDDNPVLAERLGRTVAGIRNRRNHLRWQGAPVPKRRRRWSEEDDRILTDLPFRELHRIAAELKRTYWATEWRWSWLRRRQRRAA
jgi:hypothetical protein